MKTTYIVIFACLSLVLTSFKSVIPSENKDILLTQNTTVVEGVYDGHEDYGYNFIIKGEDDNEHTFTFQKVDEAILTEFDLNGTALVGTKFKVTYKTVIVKTKDADNFDEENEIDTIIKLEKL